MSSFLEDALQRFNSAAQSAQESAAYTIDEAKISALAQSKNAAVEQADTQKIDSTMMMHHFGGKIVDFLDKYIDSDFGINDVKKRPAKAKEEMDKEEGDDPDDPEAGSEMITIETQPPPPPEPPGVVADDPAVDADVATTGVGDPLGVVTDGPVPLLDVPVASVPDAPAAADAPDVTAEADLLPQGAGGVVGEANVRSLLTRPSRLVQDQQEASAGDPVVAPPPAAAGAGEAEAAAAADAEAAAAAAESEEALALL